MIVVSLDLHALFSYFKVLLFHNRLKFNLHLLIADQRKEIYRPSDLVKTYLVLLLHESSLRDQQSCGHLRDFTCVVALVLRCVQR